MIKNNKKEIQQSNDGYEDFIKNQVFVGMQFENMNDIYEVIKNVSSQFQLNCIRVDELVNSNSIMDDIETLIEESEFIFLDLSYENVNVYYEMGYTFGVGNKGKDVLLMAKEGTKLHFDVRHRRVLFYTDAYDLQKKLNSQLKNFIVQGRN